MAIMLAKENTITFRRVSSRACTHYEIYGQLGDDLILIDTIANPKTPNLISENECLEYNDRKYWEINEVVIAESSSDVTVLVNGVRLNTLQYTFSPKLNVLNIHIDICQNDRITIEYNVDKIQFKHSTDKDYKYRVVPVFNNTFMVGNHNFLNY